MGIWRSLNGTVVAEITSAEPTSALLRIQHNEIPVEKVRFLDAFQFRFQARRQDMNTIKALTDKYGEKLDVIENLGFFWKLQSLLHRPLLVGGILVLLLLTALLPTRIFFFRVEGNVTVPDRLILEVANSCGVGFGTPRREIRSEKVKNALLQVAPELEWAGVNTAGCVATISVRERQSSTQNLAQQGISSIVATRDGVVQELTVTGGSAACKVGQAVTEGQVLISGYTDCGLSIRATRAKGEIFATTKRELSLYTLRPELFRGIKTAQTKKYSVIFGKKRINFYQDSGILDTGCVKIYEQKFVTLPGGFVLPIAIVTETWISYREEMSAGVVEENTGTLSRLAEQYLRSQMVAGKILARQEDFNHNDESMFMAGQYECLEMIGRERSEEIIAP